MKSLDFYFDIYSPYAYLGFHRLRKIAREHNCEINYRPVDLKRLKKAAGNTGPANIEIPPKIRYLMTDLKRWATRYGLPFGDIPKGKNYARINKGVFYAIERGDADAYIASAYATTWGRGGDADDDGELRALARTLSWDEQGFMGFLDSSEANDTYENTAREAISRGVFGVPIVIMGDDMWWGNDRMDFLEEALERT